MFYITCQIRLRAVQGVKKVIFTDCHSGKLELTITSPNIISTSPRNVLMSRLISKFFFNLNSSKDFTCPSGKFIIEFTRPISKSTNPWLSDTTLFARCSVSSLQRRDTFPLPSPLHSSLVWGVHAPTSIEAMRSASSVLHLHSRARSFASHTFLSMSSMD